MNSSFIAKRRNAIIIHYTYLLHIGYADKVLTSRDRQAGIKKETDRERERERDIQTEREADRERGRQRERQTEREKDREREITKPIILIIFLLQVYDRRTEEGKF